MSSTLYERTTYLNPDIQYLFNNSIKEYDLSSAGLNIIKEFKLVPEDIIKKLELMDKKSRNEEIGMMQRNDHTLRDNIERGFVEARRRFFEANDITDDDILSIKKDAIFIIDKECVNNTFGYLNFRVKNHYLGFLYLNRVEFYYKDRDSELDVKNLGTNFYNYHKDYMLDFIKDYFTMNIYSEYKIMVNFITDFIKHYRNRELDINYYRQLDIDSYFSVNIDGSVSKFEYISDEDIEKVDITYNYFSYLIPMVNIVLG
ncbi:MAG: hypothetical protein SPF22_08230 [Candidatus Onthovivens sp.]|nr:hypothetical protein [Candidatus Onthovivens sp.]